MCTARRMCVCMYMYKFLHTRRSSSHVVENSSGRTPVLAQNVGRCVFACPWRACSLLSRAKHTPASRQQQRAAPSPDSRAQRFISTRICLWLLLGFIFAFAAVELPGSPAMRSSRLLELSFWLARRGKRLAAQEGEESFISWIDLQRFCSTKLIIDFESYYKSSNCITFSSMEYRYNLEINPEPFKI
jgi:hypothetical protein